MTETERARTAAVLLTAALVYVGAWIVGLIVAPSAPSETAADQRVQAFFVAHKGSTLIQSLLVHGVAGLAFLMFVISLAKLMPPSGSPGVRTLFLVAGLAAVVVSLIQVGLEIGLNPTSLVAAERPPPRRSFTRSTSPIRLSSRCLAYRWRLAHA